MKIYDFLRNVEHNKNYGAMDQIERGIVTDVRIYSIGTI